MFSFSFLQGVMLGAALGCAYACGVYETRRQRWASAATCFAAVLLGMFALEFGR